MVADLVGLHACRHLRPTEISEEPIVQHLGNAYEAEGKNRSEAISRIMEAFDSERGQLLRPLLPFDDGRLPWKSSDLKVTSSGSAACVLAVSRHPETFQPFRMVY